MKSPPGAPPRSRPPLPAATTCAIKIHTPLPFRPYGRPYLLRSVITALPSAVSRVIVPSADISYFPTLPMAPSTLCSVSMSAHIIRVLPAWPNDMVPFLASACRPPTRLLQPVLPYRRFSFTLKPMNASFSPALGDRACPSTSTILHSPSSASIVAAALRAVPHEQTHASAPAAHRVENNLFIFLILSLLFLYMCVKTKTCAPGGARWAQIGCKDKQNG